MDKQSILYQDLMTLYNRSNDDFLYIENHQHFENEFIILYPSLSAYITGEFDGPIFIEEEGPLCIITPTMVPMAGLEPAQPMATTPSR